MATALKTLLNTVCAEINVAQQTSFVGSSGSDAQTILALANAAGLELMQKFAWQTLQTEYRFTYNYQVSATATTTAGSNTITNLSAGDVAALQTSAQTGLPLTANVWWVGAPNGSSGVPQDTYLTAVNAVAFSATMTQKATSSAIGVTFSQTRYPLPADFDRMIDRTHWDKSKHWEMMGPSSPQQRQWLKSGYISTGPRIRWWLQGGLLQLWPALATNEYLGYEYVSNLWAIPVGSTTPSQTAFLTDNDTAIYRDRLLIALIKFKYATAKGLATEGYAQELSNLWGLMTAEELGAPILSLAPRLTNVLVGINNIPDSGYGQ